MRSRRRIVVAVALAVGTLGLTTATAAPGSTVQAACSITTTLRLGSSGPAVACLQSRLIEVGYSPGPVDGGFGAMTRATVIAYQRGRGLYVDGVVGPQTAGALGIWATGSPPPPPPPPPPLPPPPPAQGGGCSISTTLRIGSRGVAVQCLQTRLTQLGLATGPIDGGFGSVTHRAVVSFQRSRSLFVDGVVGPQTGRALGIWGTTTPGPTPSACASPGDLPADARQAVVVTSTGSAAEVDVLTRSGAEWTCALSDLSARVGRNGVRPLLQRRSGDGTTPGGVFPLGSMTAPDGETFQFFGNGPELAVQGGWRQVQAGDCWGATPGTADYNRLVTRTAANCVGADEYLPSITGAYSAAALIGANMGQDRSGDQPGEPPYAAAIFLHRHSYDAAGSTRATAGCVSLNATNLANVLRLLVPGETYFVIR